MMDTTQFWIIVLTNGVLFLALLAAGAAALRDPRTFSEQLGKSLRAPNFLRVATVVIIVYATIILGVAGKLESSSLSAILSGVAGYVLGGLSKDNNQTGV